MSEFFSDVMQWWLDVILWIPRMLFSFVVDVVETLMGWLPADTIDVDAALDGLTGDVLYFLTLFEFGYGLIAVFTALIARFILRRIPIIG